ncbi:hypothetical protein GH714_007978 [Hevea brasiliensis]|uniref:Uncharacterized protein n=1 Tax=Hevea brasiliensis TaxID=3981 RepID=A0A6A6MX13_HEVBR|nr:hypothetical protein GH714_007978 [Hevea brasiliensis]
MDLDYLWVFDILDYARDFDCGKVLSVYTKPIGKIEDEFILLWNDKVLLDVYKEIREDSTLMLYVAHMWEELDNARLTREESFREAKEPPFPTVTACNVIEEVEANQGPSVVEVVGKAKVFDLKVILLEGGETKVYEPYGGDREACEPHVEVVDQYSQCVDADPCDAVVEEELEALIDNDAQQDHDLHLRDDSSEDESYQIGSKEGDSIEDDTSDEDLKGLSDEEEFQDTFEGVDVGFDNDKGNNRTYAGKVAGDEDFWGSSNLGSEDLSDFDSNEKDADQLARRRSRRIYYDLECQILVWELVENNMGETFNSWILTARHKSIITMMEEIKVKIMNRIRNMRDFATTWISDTSPIVMDCLEKNTRISNMYRIEWNGEFIFEVTHGEYRHTVDLSKEKCACRSWELKGIPVLMPYVVYST